MAIESEIRKHVLENAVKFGGKANPGAIVGKLMGSHEELRKDAKAAMKLISEIVKEVNSLGLEKQKAEILKLNPDYFDEQKQQKKERKEKRKELPELPNAVDGKVVTRIPPEPSKYNHLGHALSFLINYLYAKKYNGKAVLRFEDTNPEKESQEFVDAMNKDVLEYLEIKPDRTVYASDNMPKYYAYAEQLIKKGNAYVCFCKSEDISRMRRSMEECKCRAQKNTEELWEGMKEGKYKEGECSLRLKVSMDHKNAVMRDPVIMRIVDAEHYRQGKKFKVWPMYDFENPIEDALCGVTHVLRSNEFQDRIELHRHIQDLLGLQHQEIRQYGRFNITGAVTQGREIRAMIESGEASGWDDPKLITLRALKRRGIVKDAFYELAVACGMSKTQTNLDFSVLAAINRKILDESAQRYFFIKDPVELDIEGAPEQEIELDLHPETKKGGRNFKVKERFYVERDDLKKFSEGNIYRLMDCLNFVKKGQNFIFHSVEYEKYKDAGNVIVHWLSRDTPVVKASIRMPDNSIIEGIAEEGLSKAKEGDVVQMERLAFARLDKKSPSKLEFWFTHN